MPRWPAKSAHATDATKPTDGRRRKRRRIFLPQAQIAENAAVFGISLPKELTSNEKYLSPNDIGRILGVTGEAVKQWIYSRRLPAVKLGNGYWKVKVADFEKYLKDKSDVGRRRILVIANQDIGQYSKVISDMGHQPIEVFNFIDALLKVMDLQPALIVIDVRNVNYEGFISKIRANKMHSKIPIILIGANDGAGDKAVELEVQAFLEIPVSGDSLKGEVDRILNRTL